MRRRILRGEQAMAVTSTVLCLDCHEAVDRSVADGINVRVTMERGAVWRGGFEQG